MRDGFEGVFAVEFVCDVCFESGDFVADGLWRNDGEEIEVLGGGHRNTK